MPRPQHPFLPLPPSPEVQTPFELPALSTTYSDQFRGYHLDRMPTNYAQLHYAKLKEVTKLTHEEHPSDHYATSAATITSPMRRTVLAESRPPDPFPLEVRRRVITSRFDFQTTSEAVFGATVAAAKRQLRASSKEEVEHQREQRRRERQMKKAGSVSFQYDNQPTGKQERAHSPLAVARSFEQHVMGGGNSFQSTKQLVDSYTQHSLARLQSRGDACRDEKFSFPEQYPVEHSERPFAQRCETSYERTATSISRYWKEAERNAQDPPFGVQKQTVRLPTISLSYKDDSPLDDDMLLCNKCKARKSKVAECQRANRSRDDVALRSKTMHSTYDELMGNPRRSATSMF